MPETREDSAGSFGAILSSSYRIVRAPSWSTIIPSYWLIVGKALCRAFIEDFPACHPIFPQCWEGRTAHIVHTTRSRLEHFQLYFPKHAFEFPSEE